MAIQVTSMVKEPVISTVKSRVSKTKSSRRQKSDSNRLFSKTAEGRLVNSVGYDPISRKHYIDRTVRGISFRLYSLYEVKVIDYIKGKIWAANQGLLAKEKR